MTTQERASRYLASLRRWTRLLRQYAEQWEDGSLDERERQAFPLEWDNALDRLDDLNSIARRGDIDAATLTSFRQFADELAELIPTMQRLKLRQPDPEALRRARAVEAA